MSSFCLFYFVKTLFCTKDDKLQDQTVGMLASFQSLSILERMRKTMMQKKNNLRRMMGISVKMMKGMLKVTGSCCY